MSKRLRRRLIEAAAITVLAAPGAALAQAADAAPEVAELVVTAQRREQNPIDVPISLTAYSGNFLDQVGVQEFDALARITPGFEVLDQSPNNPSLVMRGITSDALDAYNEPRISVFQDGVDISKAVGSYIELFDIERVEIAKGPQSTLYGRGALIGAVDIIQNKANPADFAAYGAVEGGDYGYILVDGMLNAPVWENFAIRAAGRYKNRDGYVDNLLGGDNFNGVETWAGRLSFGGQVGERFDFDVIGNYQRDDATGTSFKSRAFLPTNPQTGAVLGGSEPWEGATLAAPAGFFDRDELGTRRELWGVTGIGRLELSDSLSLTSITAFRNVDSSEVGDADGISLPIISFESIADHRQFSQEVRVNFDNGGRVSWFAGVNYYAEEGEFRSPAVFDERIALAQLTGQLNASAAGLGLPANVPAPMPVFGNTAFTGALVQGLVFQTSNGNILLSPAQAQAIAANLKPNHAEVEANTNDLKAWDLFGDVTFKATDRLELGAGLRFSAASRTTGYRASVLNGRSILGGVIGAAGLAADGSPVGIGTANALLGALSVPGAATIPPSPFFPVPLFGLTFQPTANNGDETSVELDDSGFTWRLTARYALSDDASLYATYARGRRPEVLAATAPPAPGGSPRFNLVDAETVDSYEVGAKALIPDLNLRLDGAVFYYQYDNFQTVIQQGTTFIPSNAGEATSYGFEGQATWRPIDQVELFATYAYNHGRFTSGALEDNHFRLSPDHKLSLGAFFNADVLGGRITFNPLWTWQSKIFFEDDNDRPDLQTRAAGALVPDLVQDEFQEGYSLVHLRLSYTPDGGRWQVRAFVNNVFDEEYVKDAGNTGDGIGLPTFIAGEPRMWGLGFNARY